MPATSRHNTKNWKLPDDAYEHYADLFQKTASFRDIPMHEASGYQGPWVENHFIDHFMGKPLDFFQGLIPLFIQFVDIHVYSFREKHLINASIPEHSRMFDYLAAVELYTTMYIILISFAICLLLLLTICCQMLRKDVLYLAISQDDEGLGSRIHTGKMYYYIIRSFMCYVSDGYDQSQSNQEILLWAVFNNVSITEFPNILVLSAGGYGNIAIPLIKGLLCLLMFVYIIY